MTDFTEGQIITWLIALLAVVVSLAALIRAGEVQKQQLRLQKKQEELTDLQLEALRKQASSVPTAPPEKADVRVDLEKVGRGDFKFLITNWGTVPANHVTFDLELPEGARSPLVSGDYDEKIPIDELAPGSRLPLWAAITMGMGTSFPVRWTWRNPDGSTESRKSLLGI